MTITLEDARYSVSVKTYSKTVHVILHDVLGEGYKWILPKSIAWAIEQDAMGGQDDDGYWVTFDHAITLTPPMMIDMNTGEVLWEREV